ncbi:MAG: hypothetical protein ACKOCW_12050 [Planctomycetaceae bacterium]
MPTPDAIRRPPPVDTPARTTSRGQAARIERDYYRRPNALHRARRWLGLVGLVAGVAWVAWGAIDQPRHHSPGPVAAVHARWERDCEACHVPLEPIKDGTFLSTAASRAQADARCEACHAGPAHHPRQRADEVGSCASCHADHRGRDADIVRVADRTCTQCHGDLAAHRGDGIAGVEPRAAVAPITGFAVGRHPPFRSLDKDPGRLKFSHGRHMLPGLSFAPTTGGVPADAVPRGVHWTYAMLPEADRARYQPAHATDADAVQLSCASCHEFAGAGGDDLRHVPALLAGAAPGAYALPVSFERHCAACHQLPFAGVTTGDAVVDQRAGTTAAEEMLPHGLSADGLRRLLETAALRHALDADAALLDQPPASPPLPSIRDSDPAARAVRGLVDERVARWRTFARATCEKCHATTEVALPAATGVLPAVGGRADPGWFAVEPPGVPDIWLTKARFNHQPHRSFDCRECHAAAYPGADTVAAGLAGRTLDNDRVMIAGLEGCASCHAPAGRDPTSGRGVGGVRHDCVECHGYHGLGPHLAPPAVAGAGQGK